MEWMILGIVSGFIGLEIVSVFIHKYLFHGLLWRIHQTHHQKRKGAFEANDLFSLIFALLGLSLLTQTHLPYIWGMGLGVTLYGVLYFFIHDLMAHRRFYPLKGPKFLSFWIHGHRRHHQKVDKRGQGPWGLFSGY